jgi:hypothetical protein
VSGVSTLHPVKKSGLPHNKGTAAFYFILCLGSKI